MLIFHMMSASAAPQDPSRSRAAQQSIWHGKSAYRHQGHPMAVPSWPVPSMLAHLGARELLPDAAGGAIEGQGFEECQECQGFEECQKCSETAGRCTCGVP